MSGGQKEFTYTEPSCKHRVNGQHAWDSISLKPEVFNWGGYIHVLLYLQTLEFHDLKMPEKSALTEPFLNLLI